MPDIYGNPSTRPGGGTRDVADRRTVLEEIAAKLGRPRGGGGGADVLDFLKRPQSTGRSLGEAPYSPSVVPPEVPTGRIPFPEGGEDTEVVLARYSLGNTLPLRLEAELIDPTEAERAMQTLLNTHGAELDTDGYAGPATIKALNEFVRRYLPEEPEITEGSVLDERILDLLRTEP